MTTAEHKRKGIAGRTNAPEKIDISDVTVTVDSWTLRERLYNIVMKKLILATLGLLALAVTTVRGDETTYTLEMTGVTWGGCKSYVRAALQKTFNATSIIITSGDKPKTQKVIFTAKDKSITKREASDAMGEKKRRFVVERVKKAKKTEKAPEGFQLDGQWHLLLLHQSPYIRV